MTDVASVVERYYAVVADRDGSADALRALLHPDVRIVEHPNAINPKGAVRDRDAAVAGYLAGQRLLTEQTFDAHETLTSGSRVAVRATWHLVEAVQSPAVRSLPQCAICAKGGSSLAQTPARRPWVGTSGATVGVLATRRPEPFARCVAR